MILLSISSEHGLKRFAREKFNTLLLSEEKAIIFLFRSGMGMDSFVEEFLNLQEQITTKVQPIQRNPAFEGTKII